MKDLQPKGYQETAHLSGDERISLLEELHHLLYALKGIDYSQRMQRVISYSKRPQH
jgi:hypothetical protein